ncbi:MAG: hypothetical protein NT139_01170 [Candidatus Woesearchaeota archaeon]|nr:hypothetical protein [Candidatus Woesearchaeota archaeon]
MTKYRKSYASYIMDNYHEKVFIYLPGATVKGTNYDKFRDVGYIKGQQNYLTVKAWIRDTTPNELIIRQLGLIAIGAKKLIVKNNDVELFKLASRIVIKDEDYYVYNDAVGKKMQLLSLDENYSEITLFRKEV